MVVLRKNKTHKYRGSKTHGWGSMKKHRGAGNRGGRGNAGRGKHGSHKKLSRGGKVPLKEVGFSSHKKPLVTVNICDVNTAKLKQDGEMYIIDRSVADKLLGVGRLDIKLKVTIPVTKRAKEKVESAGGLVENVST